jgi:hypothetical protein
MKVIPPTSTAATALLSSKVAMSSPALDLPGMEMDHRKRSATQQPTRKT